MLMKSQINGYTVRALNVREMRAINAAHKDEANAESMSYAVAAVSIEKDGKSIGADALNALPWPLFQRLLRDVLAANSLEEDATDPNA